MRTGEGFVFGAFRLDATNQQLWRGDEAIPVRPKLFAVLRYMVENQGRLVTRDELLRAVWGRVHVGETMLRGTMRDLRAILQDDVDAPRFIETVPHRGYRFIAQVGNLPAQPLARRAAVRSEAAGTFVEREAELEQLREWLSQTLDGHRQVVFVTGEPGIGKTTLVDSFVALLPHTNGSIVGRGQCVEQYGAGEAYLPVLDAIGRMCRQREGKRVLAVLNQYAPTWLVQMPALLSDAELQTMQRKVQGAGRERMLREMAEALEALAAEVPIVLVFEDLHWSDHSTLDLIGLLARRRESARLMIVGTYRPADAIASGHPLRGLKQDLHSHGQCRELPLGFLSEQAVHEYLTARLDVDPAHDAAFAGLVTAVHRRSDGNPLFMVNIADYLVAHGTMADNGKGMEFAKAAEEVAVRVPEGLRQLIERQLERLPIEEQRLLEAASVAGATFSAAALAAGLDESLDRVEERCDELAQRNQFLDARGTTSVVEGAPVGYYEFRHALYQQALYNRLPSARQARLHRRIGEQEESLYGDRAAERAAQLAVHFERAQEYARAVPYLKRAAENALRRSAFQEAIALLEKALQLLDSLPKSKECIEQELGLRMLLSTPLVMTKGYASAEVEQVTSQARDLSRRLEESPALLPALIRMTRFYFVRGELDDAAELGERCVRLAESAPGAAQLIASALMGCIRYSRGELLEARKHTQRCIAAYDVDKHGSIAVLFGDDPGIMSMTFDAVILWAIGYPDQAKARIEQALLLAERIAIPYCKGFALIMATWIHLYLRRLEAAAAHLEELVQLSTAHGFQFLLAQAFGLRGWLLLEQGVDLDAAIESLERGLAALTQTGVAIGKPRLLCSLAEALARKGDAERALHTIDQVLALSTESVQRIDKLQALRIKGELLLEHAVAVAAPSPAAAGTAPGATTQLQAEAYFREAIEICRARSAKSLELRATMSLCRLWIEQGKTREAQAVLAELYGWFSEGFDTVALREAKHLLQEVTLAAKS